MLNVLRNVVDTVFPVTCPACGICLPARSYGLCSACLQQVRFIDACCHDCGKPLFYGGAHCYRCLRQHRKYPFVALRSVCLYKGVIKDIIHMFKYSGKEYLGRILGRFMVSYLKSHQDIPMHMIDGIVPVPLYWQRKFRRGYNQAESLGRSITRAFNKELLLHAAERIKPTVPQYRLTREERFANLRDAFRIYSNAGLKQKNLLIVDDVCTTGSTLEEFSRVLKQAGAAQIYALTAARG